MLIKPSVRGERADWALTQRGWNLTQVLSDMSFATESEWAKVIGEKRYEEFRSTLCELVAYTSPAIEEAVSRK
jgi:hypothetical protein